MKHKLYAFWEHDIPPWGNDKGCNYSNTVIAYDVSELGYENCIR